MPAAWTAKDERQYGHILSSCHKRGRVTVSKCKSIAAATVNKRRRREGRALSDLELGGSIPLVFAGAGGVMLLMMLSKVRQVQAERLQP